MRAVKVKNPDGSHWFTETGSDKHDLIKKLQGRANSTNNPDTRSRVENVIRQAKSAR